jgi:hypothetical protein
MTVNAMTKYSAGWIALINSLKEESGLKGRLPELIPSIDWDVYHGFKKKNNDKHK